MAATEITRSSPFSARLRETLRQVRKNWSAYLFIAPGLIHFAIFTLFAVGFAFYISFHEWNIIKPDKPYVGLENYVKLFGDPRFLRAVKNTLTFMVGVPLNLLAGLFVALLLNTKVRGQAIYRTLFYIPVVTPLVVSSIIWKWVYQGDYGLLNYYLLQLGIIDHKISWLADPNLALPALIIMGIWGGTGATMVIYLAGLQSIPEEMYDAAKVDGANALQRLLFITIPLLRPTTFFLFITAVIGTFQIFTEVYIMTNGGPLNRTTTIGYYLYTKAFRQLEMGYATAMAFVLFAMIFVFTVIQWKYTRGDVEY
ncbi:MAG TPA: sugar ABC transporter permease [Anaerolineales bacterium]|jgi:multiple sugar transport system permease protein|nr:sugar ABC transporter permease [Anaerolineales bacterium]